MSIARVMSKCEAQGDLFEAKLDPIAFLGVRSISHMLFKRYNMHTRN